jgi:hypothetical protein
LVGAGAAQSATNRTYPKNPKQTATAKGECCKSRTMHRARLSHVYKRKFLLIVFAPMQMSSYGQPSVNAKKGKLSSKIETKMYIKNVHDMPN